MEKHPDREQPCAARGGCAGGSILNLICAAAGGRACGFRAPATTPIRGIADRRSQGYKACMGSFPPSSETVARPLGYWDLLMKVIDDALREDEAGASALRSATNPTAVIPFPVLPERHGRSDQYR